MPSLVDIIKKVAETPTLSESATLLINLMSKPGHNTGDVARVIECDALLTAKVIEVANSSAFSPLQPITSISRAVSHMGDKIVVGIAVASCAKAVYDKDLDGYESKRGELWEHSLMTAIASREVAKASKGKVSRELAYTGGLLHDIGKSVISEFLGGATRMIVDRIDSGRNSDYLEAERAILRTDHCNIGAKLAKHWKLPSPLQAVIKHHHKPALAEPGDVPLAYVVHLGDMLAMMSGSGTGADSMMYHIDKGYEEYIKISADDWAAIMASTVEEFNATKDAISGG